MDKTKINKVKIQIASDLHLESSYIDLDCTDSDILILAGDIHSDIGKLQKYIKYILRKNKIIEIIIIAGNHEHYSKTVPETIKKMTRLLNIPRSHFLHNNFVIIHGIKFIGSTLWCNPPGIYWDEISKSISDFNYIKNYNILDCIEFFDEAIFYIQGVIEKDVKSDKTVVITHFSPSLSSIKQEFQNNSKDKILNHYYATDIENIIRNLKPALWIHGHMHNNSSYYIDDTKIICNPRGYSNNYNGHEENVFFNKKLIIEL